MTLDDLIKEEHNGAIFCKIGKSSINMWGKGGYFPYRDYIGKVVILEEGSITFESLEEVVKYLHYGDDLVIFNFMKGKDLLPEDGYRDNGMNKGCYNTKSIYVDNVLSFCDPNTVDFIYSNIRNKNEFYEYCGLATSHLEDRNLIDAAKRWKALAGNKI
ncbi:hypothetical protein SAMN05443270_4624 [Lacrimispora sphenoides]|jgi:hypothetical protein|uniref:hypothetical protein n=1 Tax=Lacrimispora sphenoides TaxID=29370 RepID=UPI0008BCE43C|nr:hypothetical protein [Lacrimispora sphenoides]SEU28827.1 hypothetical protein SAMN05443270_4624 [Lacrimispora sphenoides]